MIIFLVGSIVACSKNNEDIPQSVEESRSTTALQLLERSSLTSRKDILQSKYAQLFHYYQFANQQQRLACGPTAYMCATKAIAKYHGKDLILNKTLQDRIGNYTGWENTTPYNLYNYWVLNKDNFQSYITCDYARGAKNHPNKENWTTRTKIKEFIETALSEKKLIILPVKINGSNRSNWQNDHSTSGTFESSNYISKDGNIGHYIILYRLDRQFTQDGFSIGTAYYLDVYESQAGNALKTVNYLRLLDANKATSNSGNYSALWLSDPK